jgi:demethylmenaquinone methyltransferase/2-methoxy-6-polyprenyl-1,4-benzoquinol methylase
MNIHFVLLPIFIAYIAYLIFGYFTDKKEDSGYFGSGLMFDSIAQYYDIANRFMSLGNDIWWRKQLVNSIRMQNNDVILDLATGTGDLAIMIMEKFHSLNIFIHAVDPSVNMLAIAKEKSKSKDIFESIIFDLGNAENLDFDNSYFDKITMSFGIRNVKNRNSALSEIRRVLKSPKKNSQTNKYKLFIMEFLQPNQTKELISYFSTIFLNYCLPLIGTVFSGGNAKEYIYLKDSILNFPSVDNFLLELKNAGFSNCKVENVFFSIVYLFKCE